MFCPECGKQIPEQAKFCPECGHDVIQYTSSLQKTKATSTQTAADFPELKKLKMGYIIIAATFILSALICIAMGISGFFVSLLVLVIGYLIGVYFVTTANKAAKTLPSKQSEEFYAFVKKWYQPTNLMSVVYIAALLISFIKWFS